MPDTRSTGDHSKYFRMVGRVVRAAGRRVGNGDPEDLAELIALRATLEASIDDAVRGLRESGSSWAQIAGPLGITRQSAHEKWGHCG